MKERILEKTNNAILDIEKILNNFPWGERAAYAEWLAQSYFYVRHTTRNMALACSKFSLNENEFHYSFIDHLKEEKGHEKLALNDIRRLGYSIEQFSENAETAALYQAMYFLIDKENPISILGFALVLEGMAAQKMTPICNKLIELHGPQATSLIKVHTVVDVGHSEETFHTLKLCSMEQLVAIDKAVTQCHSLYQNFYKGVYNKLMALDHVTESSGPVELMFEEI